MTHVVVSSEVDDTSDSSNKLLLWLMADKLGKRRNASTLTSGFDICSSRSDLVNPSLKLDLTDKCD